MKVKLDEVVKVGFRPFELVIKVETIEELWCLWHRMNIGTDLVDKSYHSRNGFKAFSACNTDIWMALDEKLQENT